MTLATDVAGYLVSAGIGIVMASTSGSPGSSTPVIYDAPFPDGSQDYSVCVLEYGGLPAIRAMGASTTSPVAEIARFQVVVRHDRNNYGTARGLAEDIYEKVDHAVFTSTGSVRYLYMEALGPVGYLNPGQAPATDKNNRHRFFVNVEAIKERG